MNVSILIIAYNEEKNLPACLNALTWCNDIVLVDSGSTDQTVELAARAGVRILRRQFDDFASQRNYGLEHGNFKHDWVLHLDADEVLTPDFILALYELVPEAGVAAFRVPSKLILFGQWLKNSGMYPTYQVRLGLKDQLRFAQVGHGQREMLPESSIGIFSQPYLHYSFSGGMTKWLERHIRYAKDEAKLILDVRRGQSPSANTRRHRLKNLSSQVPLWLRPCARFVYVYFVRRGFLDGRSGLMYSVMLASYEGMVSIFAYELLIGKASNIPSNPT